MEADKSCGAGDENGFGRLSGHVITILYLRGK